MTHDKEEEIIARLTSLEGKVNSLVTMWEQATGAWLVIKWLGATGIVLAGLWAKIFPHKG